MTTERDHPRPLRPASRGRSLDAADADRHTCTISATALLTCTGIGNLAPGAWRRVVVTAPTSFVNCGTYDNTATVSAGEQPRRERRRLAHLSEARAWWCRRHQTARP